jgi:3,4-dihydroxy 2-butanone 4-phosphate synthase/GTP cyclohydrolase II
MSHNTVEQALKVIADGGMVVVMDDEDRENEGDIIMAAQFATPQALAFMVRWTSGVLCVALPAERLEALDLPLMVRHGEDPLGTAFTVTVDHRLATTTGISAADRAVTIRALVDPDAKATDFRRPGHIFPLRAVPGGVLSRPGHTEAAVDLTRLAGLRSAGVLAEIVNDDGTMAQRLQLFEFADAHGLPIISIRDIIAFRRRNERIVERRSTARLPTRYGVFTAHGYVDTSTGHEHVAMVIGAVAQQPHPLVRVHSECLTGDVFGSLRCDCRPQLELALSRLASKGCGVVVYLRGHEGRGIGLTHKLRAYALQDDGCDTVQANLRLGLPVDARDYRAAAQILEDLGVRSMRLMTNNPKKCEGLAQHGLSIVERVPLTAAPNSENERYLLTKQRVLGHLLDLDETA